MTAMIKTLTSEEKLNVNGGWLQVVGVTILLDALLNPSGKLGGSEKRMGRRKKIILNRHVYSIIVIIPN